MDCAHTHAHSHTSASINVNSGFILFETPTCSLVRDKPSPTGLVQRVGKKIKSLHVLVFLVTANVGTYQGAGTAYQGQLMSRSSSATLVKPYFLIFKLRC